tara:strand:+ start:280 stop:537 length:258 start_codon:yes stop_codon:yes gene_type:complete
MTNLEPMKVWTRKDSVPCVDDCGTSYIPPMWAVDVDTSEEHYIMIPKSDPAEVAYGEWEDDDHYYINWHDATYQVQSIDLEFQSD